MTEINVQEHCADHIALLVPVPKEHLDTGQNTSLTEGKVAFGSRAYDVFIKLEQERGDKPIDVYIYESYGEGKYDSQVSWRARYLGLVEAVNGKHPQPELRPPVKGGVKVDQCGGGKGSH